MNLIDYFDPSDALPLAMGISKSASVFGKVQILGISKDIKIDNKTLVLLGVNESRNSSNPGASKAADAIRKYFYGLSGNLVKKPLVDLGNLKITGNPSDTYMALRDVVEYLLSKGATCMVLGGTQELTWPLFLATAQDNKQINLSIIDSTIDMGSGDGDFSSTSYIDRIINEKEDALLSLSMLGYQSYLVDSKHLDELSARNFELSRLGFVRGAMAEVEPTLRDSQIVSLDLGCIKHSDSPGSVYPSPNGFYSEEICQLARYSGISSKSKVFGVFELNTSADAMDHSASLAAQVVWHYVEGFNARSKYPSLEEGATSLKRFYVKSPIPNVELVFIQNTLNDTWWFELPPTPKSDGKPIAIACSSSDYQRASKGDVPDRWLRISRRLN
jgi:formiminoglutamase